MTDVTNRTLLSPSARPSTFVLFTLSFVSMFPLQNVQAQVVFEEFTETNLSTAQLSVTVSTPAGTTQDDLLIAAIAVDRGVASSLAPPPGEGWALIDVGNGGGQQVTLGVWWKLAAASESPTHEFTWASPTQQSYAWMMRFTGHDPAAPIDVSATIANTATLMPVSPAVTTTVANAMILRLGGFDDDDVTIDDPGLPGHTAITMDISGTGFGTVSGGAGYVLQAATGDSGTSTSN